MSHFKKFNLVLLVLAVFGLGILTGFFSSSLSLRPRASYEKHERGYEFTNPLLECDIAKETEQENFLQLNKELKTIIKNNENAGKTITTSVYVRDLNNGPWMGVNEEEKFTPASLLKVPLMIAYYKLTEKDPTILQKKIKYESLVQVSQQFIPPKKTVELGKEYTIKELLTYMIGYSDNMARALLFDNINSSDLNEIYGDLGIAVPSANTPEDYMSVHDYSAFFRILYNASYLNRENSEKALRLLTEVDFDRGILAGVPKNIRVASKFGERELRESNIKQLHECGIVYASQKPYLLCVMTRGYDLDTLAGVIQSISSITYKFITNAR